MPPPPQSTAKVGGVSCTLAPYRARRMWWTGPVTDDGSRSVRVRLDLKYDGAQFHGWAKQPGLRTVQGELETAMHRITRLRQPPRLTVAGRTDAGVHARGQVAHVDLPEATWLALPGRSTRPPAQALRDRLGAVLPADVVVAAAGAVPEAFDARFSALWRCYRYRIADTAALCDPLTRAWVHWHRRELDVPAMNLAAAALVGEWDFAAYCKPRAGATTIRTLLEFSWFRDEHGLAVAHVRADAFCHSMVRALVGACLAVGERRREISWPGEVLGRGVRDSAVHVAAADGLTLEEVAYPADAAGFEARARQARARRGAPSELGRMDSTEG